MLRVDVTKQLGEFTLQASFTSEGRVTGLFGASGAGKTSLINMIAGLLRPDRGSIIIDGGSDMCSRMRGCFRISMCGKISTTGGG
jgi:ABC-type molybdate transport system ATPase subunit